MGAIPLAPTIYGYSDRLRQHRRQAMTSRVRGQVDRRVLQPEHVDPLEQGTRQEPPSRPTVGLPPGLR